MRRGADVVQRLALCVLVLGPALGLACRSHERASEQAGERPNEAAGREPAPVTRSSYESVVAPIFAARCTGCHGETKSKGKLRLDGPDSIRAGGQDGPVLVGGKPAESEIVRRLGLPIDDDDHMPPKDKPQPTAEEIRALTAWISAGAPFEGRVTGLVAPKKPVELAIVDPADPKALAALSTELVHVERLASDSNLLWIDFAAIAPHADDALVARLLEPVRVQVAEVALARSTITDASLALFARMPNLRRIDLRATKVTDAGLAALAAGGGRSVEELVLAQTSLTDGALIPLLRMSSLKRVYLWHAGLSTIAVGRLRRERPELRVDAGDTLDAAVAEVEPAIKLTKDAPIPGAPAAPAVPAANASNGGDLGPPINTVCPVTGKPVDSKYRAVHGGKVIGFCCPNCPAAFAANPDKYPVKPP